jgi:alanyl aminopeptidase
MQFDGFGPRALLRALLLGVLLAGVARAAPVPPQPVPPARLSDVVKPLAYDLQLTIVPATDKFSGRVAIDLEVNQPTPVIWLHAVRLDVHRASVTLGGKTQTARVIVGKDVIGLRLPQSIPAGRASVVVEYDGSFERQVQQGLMKIREQDDWYIATDFEPSSARRVVPCIDELGAKAPWKLTLEVPVGMAAFGNAPEVSEEALSSTMKRVHFAPTAPINSYVMAFAVGPFDVVQAGHGGRRSTPIRILVPRGTAANARFAAESTARILELDEDEVNQAYPFDKLDILAVPGIDKYGAMENVGLVTIQSDLVLAAPGHDDAVFQQNYVATMAHEISHMWFGNGVGPAGWNELWLNEGFADWLTPKTVQRFNPQWQQDLQIDDARAQALLRDRLLSTHPVRLKEDTPEAADLAFDAITYSKGASVLRMVEHFMGEDRFRDGVRHYLAAHMGGSANTEDLYAALSAAADRQVAGDVVPMLQGFLDQAGAPGLEVGLQCSEGASAGVRLDLNQFRFTPRARVAPALSASQLPAAEHWLMPVCFQYGEGGDYGETCTVMHDAHVSLALPQGESCPDWVVANTDGVGYLIALLRDPLTARLDHAPLLPNEAVPVLDDARVLVSSDAMGADIALTLAGRFANHRQPLVALASVRVVRALPQGLVDAADARDAFTRYVRKVYGPRAEALGWQVKSGEREVDDLLRSELVPMVADLGADGPLRADADRLAREALAGRTELGSMFRYVLAVAANNGNQDLFDSISNAAAKAPSSARLPEYQALGHFHDPKLLDQALDLALSDKLDVRDASEIIRAASSDAMVSTHVSDYVKTHFDAIDKRFGNAGEVLASASSGLCDRAARADLEHFIADHSARAPSLKAQFSEVFESDDLCEAGRDVQVPRIQIFLSQQAS